MRGWLVFSRRLVAGALIAWGAETAIRVSVARAEEAHPFVPAGSETLASLVGDALVRQPDVLAARERWRAARSAVPAAGALDDPMLLLGRDDQPFDDLGQGTTEIGLSQRFAFPGKLGRRTGGARALAEVERERLLETAREVVLNVKLAYFDLFQLEGQLAAMRESRDALADLIEGTRVRYEGGIAGQQELLLARVEASTLDGEILHTEALAEAARASLNLAAGRDAGDAIGEVRVDSLSAFSETLDDLLARAPSARPSLRALDRAIVAEEAALASARVAHRPDLDLTAVYRQRPNTTDEWRAELGIPIPLWKSRKQGAEARAAGHRLAAAREAHAAEANRVAQEIREQYAHVSSERRMVRLYEQDVLPQVDLAGKGARASYAAGEVSFVVLLESLRSLIDRHKTYVELLADAEMHLARLERASGVDLAGSSVQWERALGEAKEDR